MLHIVKKTQLSIRTPTKSIKFLTSLPLRHTIQFPMTQQHRVFKLAHVGADMIHPVQELETGGNAKVAMISLWIIEEFGFVFGGGRFSAVGGGDGEPT